jgi:signal transduction histidine kinase
MESLGQLTGGLAHDFNNLLHVIKNAVEILRVRLQQIDPDAARYLDMARRSADRASGITQRLLAFARRQPLDPKPVDANRLLHGMNDILRHAVGEGRSGSIRYERHRAWLGTLPVSRDPEHPVNSTSPERARANRLLQVCPNPPARLSRDLELRQMHVRDRHVDARVELTMDVAGG